MSVTEILVRINQKHALTFKLLNIYVYIKQKKKKKKKLDKVLDKSQMPHLKQE